jgi:hypothetical protein
MNVSFVPQVPDLVTVDYLQSISNHSLYTKTRRHTSKDNKLSNEIRVTSLLALSALGLVASTIESNSIFSAISRWNKVNALISGFGPLRSSHAVAFTSLVLMSGGWRTVMGIMAPKKGWR